MALLTIEKFLLNYANEQGTVSTSDTTYYQDILDSAIEMFKNEVNRPLEQATYKEKYCGSGTSNLVLKHYPVVSMTAVSNSDYIVDDIEIQDKGEINLTDAVFEEGRWNHGFTYVAGYLEADIPDDIQDAIGRLGWDMILQNKRLGDARQGKSETQTNIGNKEGNIKYRNDMIPDYTQTVIKKYKDDRTITPVERKYT